MDIGIQPENAESVWMKSKVGTTRMRNNAGMGELGIWALPKKQKTASRLRRKNRLLTSRDAMLGY